MTTAYILSGLPGSGKSTLARTLYPALRFNMDDQRAQLGLTHDRWNRETESVVFSAMLAGAKAAVLAGRDIVLDATHLTPSWPRAYRKELGPLVDKFIVHDLTHVSIEECIARDAVRADSVGEKVIRKLAANHEKARKGNWRLTDAWMNGEQWPVPEPYVAQAGLPSAFIFDIDGTLALNNGHRSPYDYSKVRDDAPHYPVVEVLWSLAQSDHILLVSGRDDWCRAETEEWIDEHIAPVGGVVISGLFMRRTGDKRPDYVVKAELFREHVADHYNVRGVFDDRLQVIERCWRAMGLTCFDVAGGTF